MNDEVMRSQCQNSHSANQMITGLVLLLPSRVYERSIVLLRTSNEISSITSEGKGNPIDVHDVMKYEIRLPLIRFRRVSYVKTSKTSIITSCTSLRSFFSLSLSSSHFS